MSDRYYELLAERDAAWQKVLRLEMELDRLRADLNVAIQSANFQRTFPGIRLPTGEPL